MDHKPTYEELERLVMELGQSEFKRRQAEEALRESENRYRTLFESNLNPIAIITPKGQYLDANSAFLDFVETSKEELLKMRVFDFSPPSDKLKQERSHVPAWDSGGTLETEYIVNGEIKTLELTITPLNYRGYKAVMGVGRDISEPKKTMEALQASEKKFRSLVEQVPEMVFLHDLDGNIIDVNFAAVRNTGYSPEELINMSVFDIVQDALNPDDMKHYWQSLQTGDNPIIFEARYRKKDGSIYSAEVSVSKVVLQDGDYILELARDITERLRTEKALKESERKWRNILVNTPQLGISLDPEGRITFANNHFRQLTGWSEEELLGRDWFELCVPPEIKEEIRTVFCSVMKGEGTLDLTTYENEILTRGGERRNLAWSNVLTRDAHGGIVDVTCLGVDLTERKRSEAALRKSEDRLATILDKSPIPTAVGGFDGSILSFNKALEKMIGYNKDEVEDIKDWAFKLYPDEKYREFVQKNINQALEGKKQDFTEFTICCKNGSNKIVSFNTSFFSDGLIIQMVDVTESRKAEQERIKLEAQLRQSQKMEAVGTLAGGIAHDFNNILGIIVGNAELAMFDLPEWSPARESLKEIREASLRARDLVNQILLFARQKEHKISNIHLGPIAKECLKMLRASIPTTVEIRQHIDESTPPVSADPSQVQQIIMNLCTNAGQAMESEGGILDFIMDSVELDEPLDSITGKMTQGSYVRMKVRDSGPGISPGDIEHVFDPFFTTKGIGEGTGLGLAVVHGIVQDRDGGIIVESEEGTGTSFIIYLPASEKIPVEEKKLTAPVLPRGSERVLFVDDEPMIMKLGRRMLERQGYEVETRASGTDALECFRQNPDRFDLVVTDMSMPGLRGDKLAEEIRKIRPDIPVILCTGFSKQISEEKAKDLGIRAFVMKPLTAHELASTVRRVLDEK